MQLILRQVRNTSGVLAAEAKSNPFATEAIMEQVFSRFVSRRKKTKKCIYAAAENQATSHIAMAHTTK